MKLKSLEYRRLIFDQIELFKIVNGFSVITFDSMFEWKPPGTRRIHNKQIQIQFARTEVAKNFFKHRPVKVWNELPDNVVNATTVATFKFFLSSTDLSRDQVCFPRHYER